MKQIIVTLYLSAACLKAYALNLTVASFPTVNEYVSLYGAGTLTQAKAAMTNPVGWASTEFDASYTWNYTKADCCTDDNEKGFSASIKNSDINVVITPTLNDVHVPSWVNRTVSCSSATNEWNRFEGEVRSHEQGHISVFKAFLVVSKLDDFFDSAISTEGACVTDYKLARDVADADITTQLDVASSWASSAHMGEQDAFHGSASSTIHAIDASKDCP